MRPRFPALDHKPEAYILLLIWTCETLKLEIELPPQPNQICFRQMQLYIFMDNLLHLYTKYCICKSWRMHIAEQSNQNPYAHIHTLADKNKFVIVNSSLFSFLSIPVPMFTFTAPVSERSETLILCFINPWTNQCFHSEGWPRSIVYTSAVSPKFVTTGLSPGCKYTCTPVYLQSTKWADWLPLGLVKSV